MDFSNIQFDQRTVMSFLLIAVAFYVGRQLPRWMSGVPYVKPDVAKAQLDQDPDTLVIDVRSPSQFKGKDGHIKDALNLPLIDLMGRIKQIKADLAEYAQTPVLVVCKSDQISARAARILRKNGLAKVAVLHGGLKAWKKAGQPVVTD
ncbi:rhodanese-like domain-containing protein [Maritimibacter sp. UBA3975]|uniref:rhodanese-like domain-containing protein n=1 Tax=Maritimibacter sp. UBA3975 TaxID=1946833 RepID=UPI0025C2484D|nr:rhodanese-like domain-containing protein [Maritimibacter sp. UBA3975]|tara:strand:- start:183 stop:626 length:444 start_codon:yes stop_codon:yes gene_type:complete